MDERPQFKARSVILAAGGTENACDRSKLLVEQVQRIVLQLVPQAPPAPPLVRQFDAVRRIALEDVLSR